MGIKNYELRITENHQIIESGNYALCIINYPLTLGALPQTPHTFLP
jgi:hypothetical protein